MSIKKLNNGKWELNIKPGGRLGKQIRRTFDTQGEAKAAKIYFESEVQKNPEWAPEKKDGRRLKDLITTWWDAHGKNLRSGQDTRKRLDALADYIKNPLATELKPSDFTKYRADRIAEGVKENTLNREHSYLKAMFNELIRIDEWKKENPVQKIRQIKIREQELTYLSKQQIKDLLHSLKASRNTDAYLIAKICLSTGARWSEAESLRTSQVRSNAISLIGKNHKARTLPVSKDLIEEIQKHAKQKKIENGPIFESAYSAFGKAIDRAGIILPDGQLSHVLRHSFASHFMQSGGNILTLQKILDHSNLLMTMRYAHMAPDHLEDTLRLNPLANI